MSKSVCLFCEHPSPNHQILLETEHWYVRMDNFPVNQGHLNIVSQRHIPNVFDLNPDERLDLWNVLAACKAHLDSVYMPNGYNVGINDGQAAGQTIMHLHIHLIPRYTGDVPNPRGGIRNFKTSLVPY